MSATAILDLERAGFTREQVEGLARLVETQLATKADLAGLATKTDLAELKADLRREIAETKVDMIKWVVGVGFAQVLVLVGALLSFLKMFPAAHP